MSDLTSQTENPPVDVVIDASVGIKWFVPEIRSEEARHYLTARFLRHVPTLFLTEFGQTLWKKVKQRGELTALEAREILHGLKLVPLELHAVKPLVEPAFEIALATGRTVYDSIYLALGAALGCTLVTADRKLFDAIQASPFADDVIWVEDRL